MKKFIPCLIMLMAFVNLPAQELPTEPVGIYFDINNLVIDRYLDTDYDPENTFTKSIMLGEDFSYGYYYDLNNKKTEGKITYLSYNNYFNFKGNDGKIRKMKPDECWSYVIGLDSFTTIRNFKINLALGSITLNNNEFAEVLAEFGSYTFYKHTYVSLGNPIITFLVSTSPGTPLIGFPKFASSFERVAFPVFKSSQIIVKKLNENEFKETDLPEMIKLLEYQYKFDQKEKLYFNNNWDEINYKSNFKYYGEIISASDTSWGIKYYKKDGTPIYKGQISTTFPTKRMGEFVWYHPNGNLRKKQFYKADKIDGSISMYHANGEIHYEYQYNKDNELVFKQMKDNSGQNLLDNSGNGNEMLYDSIESREIKREYKSWKLFASYYTDSDGTLIYQQCENNAKIKFFKNLQSFFDKEMHYTSGAVKNYAHGYMLLKFIVQPNGKPAELKIVRSLDENLDFTVKNFFASEAGYFLCKPGTVNKEKIKQEIIVPFLFNINGYSNARNYYYNGGMVMQQMMMQRQMMMQAVPMH